jgi:hypothetical protein
MIRKLAVIFLLQSSLILSSLPSFAATKKTHFECPGLGNVSVSPDIGSSNIYDINLGKPANGSISVNGKTYRAIANSLADSIEWTSLNKKTNVISDNNTIIKINGKSYDCANLDNIIGVECEEGIIKEKYNTYQRITKTKWKDITNNRVMNGEGLDSTKSLQVIWKLKCNK